VTIGLLKGVNAAGHIGWITVRCAICGAKLSLTGQKPRGGRRFEPVYACPKCSKKFNAYFCAADAKRLKYRCPYCGSKLVLVTPLPTEER
jgi:DNA-directed RNA polymerase subunit RPC12/RpoP